MITGLASDKSYDVTNAVGWEVFMDLAKNMVDSVDGEQAALPILTTIKGVGKKRSITRENESIA